MADNTKPTDAELNSVSRAAKRLWELDVNRLTPGTDYEINLQGGKKPYQTYDAADKPLFSYMKKEKFFASPTYKAFYYLLDNYERSTGQAEVVTQQEKQENWAFLDAIMDTPCMKYLHNYLAAKGLAEKKEHDFKFQLYKMWFYLYRRETRNDSSGFEHVFVGEEKDGSVTGLHNWIQIFIEERRGNIDYKGYILPKRRGFSPEEDAGDDTRILTLQFSWGQELKYLSSIFVGTSPEFEVALYTLCSLAGDEVTEVEFDDIDLVIKCYKIASGRYIGSSYPEVVQ